MSNETKTAQGDSKLSRLDQKAIKSQQKLKGLSKNLSKRRNELNSLEVRVPIFLIIGVQKGGTTWLHENLKKHPQILLPAKKEVEFFSYYNKRVEEENGIAGYLHNFNKIGDRLISEYQYQVAGEATPSYFWSTKPKRKWTNPPKNFNDEIPQSVKNLLGSNVKLILCLRNPVSRAVSAYLHHVRFGRIDYKTQRILDVGHKYGIIDMGFYYQHMTHWLEHFNLDNFKILIYEKQIKQNKQQTIEEVCEFLNVDYQLYSHSSDIDINKFHNKGLEYYFDDKGGVWLNQGNEVNDFLVVSHDEIKALTNIYSDDLSSFSKLIKIDLEISMYS